ncbi:MAG: alanine racemase [Bacteroidota bacterium]
MEISRPTLLIDKEKCITNIKMMMGKAKNSSATLRPHFKTHHSAEIAEWYRAEGVDKCTVSSVAMAEYFVENGWNDLTIAFPYNPLESDVINDLAKKAKINILIESLEGLNLAKERINKEIGYFIKIDVGTNRTGVDPRNDQFIQDIIDGASEKVIYKGLLAHAGHTYGAKDKENIEWIFNGAEKTLVELKAKFGGIISYGDTPSCSLIEDLSSYDELRPGNFVFYDWMQHQIGSCEFGQIAVCLACPVVAIHAERDEIVVHGGAVHLSKDSVQEGKIKNFGKCVSLTESGWNTEIIGDVERISQEHGVIKMKSDVIRNVKIGDLIGVIPVHSCLTADLQGHYLSTSGKRIDKIIKN